jgi:hypothetical protein
MVKPLRIATGLSGEARTTVVFVHFAMALFISGVSFNYLSRGKRDSLLARAAYLNVAYLHLDGNAATGELNRIFAFDITSDEANVLIVGQ